jgi:hypothetical protein
MGALFPAQAAGTGALTWLPPPYADRRDDIPPTGERARHLEVIMVRSSTDRSPEVSGVGRLADAALPQAVRIIHVGPVMSDITVE